MAAAGSSKIGQLAPPAFGVASPAGKIPKLGLLFKSCPDSLNCLYFFRRLHIFCPDILLPFRSSNCPRKYLQRFDDL
jgi:hypothetical protein